MGTKMMLKRYSPVNLDWDTQEIVVNEEFISEHGLKIPIEYEFEPNMGLLEVYLNGQFLHSGGGYEELDDNSIRLDLGTHEDGTPIQLEAGEEIFIKVYKNFYCSRGASHVSGTDIYDVKKQIHEVKHYLEWKSITDISQTTISKRFEELRKEFEYDEFGNYEIEYIYNAIGKIEKEIVTKGDGSTRTFTYNTTTGKIESERYEKGGQAVVKEYFYNEQGKIERVRVRND